MSLICPICQDNLINGESIDNYVNKCGHVYHSACLLPWWDSAPEPNCPECRQPCNMDTITKIFLTVDLAQGKNDSEAKSPIAGDTKTELFIRQIKEHIDIQTYNQTKDINDKFRLQNSEFSTLLLNSSQRLTSNYNEKLSVVSKELTGVIGDEHKRLLIEMDPKQRRDPSKSSDKSKSSDTDIHAESKWNDLESRPSATYTTLIVVLIFLCLVAIITIIVYSQMILVAVRFTDKNVQTKDNNNSERLGQLSQKLDQFSNAFSYDSENIRLDLEKIRQSIKIGSNTVAVNRLLVDITHKGDKLLLEQMKTDRNVNLKLEILENSILMLKAQINAENLSNSKQQLNATHELNKLEKYNSELEAKLRHLNATLAQGNKDAEALRHQIENDEALSPKSEGTKNTWYEGLDFWNQAGSKSLSVGITAEVTWVLACTVSTIIFQIYRFSFYN